MHRILTHFTVLLILVSQRFDVLVIELFGTESMRKNLEDQLRRQRGNLPTFLECFVAVYVLGEHSLIFFNWIKTSQIVTHVELRFFRYAAIQLHYKKAKKLFT